MATADKLNYLLDTKSKIKTSINYDFEKVLSDTTFRKFADKIIEVFDDYKTYIPTETLTGASFQINNSAPLNAKSNTIYGNSYQSPSILPNEYTQVEYIESAGEQYIDTGRIPSDIEDIECKVILTSGTALYGAWDKDIANSRRHLFASSSGVNIGYGTTGNATVLPDYSEVLNIYAHFENQNQILTVNGTTNSSKSDYPNNPQLNAYLFCRNVNNSPNSYGKTRIYYFKIYDNNILVRDFIPCYRNSDNVAGLYDLANNVFYNNQGDGNFTYGDKTTIPNPNYPQKIEVVEGIRNLYYAEQSYNFTPPNSGWHFINGKSGAFGSNIGTKTDLKAKVEKGKIYTIKIGSVNGIDGAQLTYENENIINYNLSALLNGYIFTSDRDGYVIVRLHTIANQPTSISDIMLTEGSIAHDYVPYGSWLPVKSVSKNLFNNIYSQTANVYKTKINANEPLGAVYCYPINLLPNTEYTLKIDMNGYQKTGKWIAGMCFENGEVISLLQYNLMKDITMTTFTTDDTGIVYVGQRYGFATGEIGRADLFFQTAKIQLEKGSTATPYEPYKENTVLIDMNIYDENNNIVGNHKLAKTGVVADELELETGVLTKKIGKLVLNGSESWIKSSASTSSVFTGALNISDMNAKYQSASIWLCTHVVYGVFGTLNSFFAYDGNENTGYQFLGISISSSIATDVATFKTWLKQQYDNGTPVIVYYILATPYEVQLEPVNIKMHGGTNNIELVSNLETNMQLEYYKDYKIV